MLIRLREGKPMLLTLAIALGLAINCLPAQPRIAEAVTVVDG